MAAWTRPRRGRTRPNPPRSAGRGWIPAGTSRRPSAVGLSTPSSWPPTSTTGLVAPLWAPRPTYGGWSRRGRPTRGRDVAGPGGRADGDSVVVLRALADDGAAPDALPAASLVLLARPLMNGAG